VVKKKSQETREGTQRDLLPIRSSHLCMEALEKRLEASFLLPKTLSPAMGCSLLFADPEETCGCLGTLCQCDGQDCTGVCGLHCIVDYA
jgi:hypothetical protein